ncbi:sigma-70 family RNA polymerase sigma factor [Gemmata sp. G18]|uniref:Sigma-70 family RNA polymerase sigma factor n=1 Tax=Gemmata palustris TaxID=2822762 RepID=A0ABS5BM65_9BACT|nr:sigma-70 family RNA polymerase sigma factor [Gemmata palustris]MBP3954802.1 sigma-70 family RNA polymerase sigma factor [Gemmata palustris]
MSDSHRRPDPDNPIDPTVAGIIRRKAARLVGSAGPYVSDREDVEQELVLHVLERVRRFDPDRGTWPAFVQCLVERFGHNWARARRAAKRAGGPLDLLPRDVPEHRPRAEPGAGLDLAEALARLPEELRDIAELLTTETVAGAARTRGVSRSAMYVWVYELRDRPELQKLVPEP